eukprot:CAMPEP_0183435106 /NCGR_PEP_ID=MMETSP0370-20130417/66385_1 /TAXON_ID=268820 /ORGANISM="Peridinium aciculiferum, Strain PAER-2" /LENGTH=71 /DNA_ID=CAMNT_0025622069 /DNA_START=69 /DNA_END=280 /DNA_ORIENTATION=+
MPPGVLPAMPAHGAGLGAKMRAGGGHGPKGVSQVGECHRWVAELRLSLAALAERCAGLEQEASLCGGSAAA